MSRKRFLDCPGWREAALGQAATLSTPEILKIGVRASFVIVGFLAGC